MARVIRNQWVWKRRNRWWRHLPRRDDSHPKMSWEDEDIYQQLRTFPSPMPSPPPKLWAAWIFRDFHDQGKLIGDQLVRLFGDKPEPGQMEIFKNTASTNIQLWKVKHLLEIRPVIFPNGEPKIADVKKVEILPDGRCIINENTTQLEDEKLFDKRKHFDEKYITAFLTSRDWGIFIVSVVMLV